LVVDPADLVDEKNEVNSAVATLKVEALPDPSFELADVTVSPATPVEGDLITVTYAMRNRGSAHFPHPGATSRIEVVTPDGDVVPIGLMDTAIYMDPGQADPPVVANYRAKQSGPHTFRLSLTTTLAQARTNNDTCPHLPGPQLRPVRRDRSRRRRGRLRCAWAVPGGA
jgi:hypothetical protein